MLFALTRTRPPRSLYLVLMRRSIDREPFEFVNCTTPAVGHSWTDARNATTRMEAKRIVLETSGARRAFERLASRRLAATGLARHADSPAEAWAIFADYLQMAEAFSARTDRLFTARDVDRIARLLCEGADWQYLVLAVDSVPGGTFSDRQRRRGPTLDRDVSDPHRPVRPFELAAESIALRVAGDRSPDKTVAERHGFSRNTVRNARTRLRKRIPNDL